jgi:hypothetical protein
MRKTGEITRIETTKSLVDARKGDIRGVMALKQGLYAPAELSFQIEQ